MAVWSACILLIIHISILYQHEIQQSQNGKYYWNIIGFYTSPLCAIVYNLKVGRSLVGYIESYLQFHPKKKGCHFRGFWVQNDSHHLLQTIHMCHPHEDQVHIIFQHQRPIISSPSSALLTPLQSVPQILLEKAHAAHVT